MIVTLLIVWYGTIFSFSAQDGETSGSLSFHVAKISAQIIDTVTFGNRTDVQIEELAGKMEFFIRKTAHFMEYAVLGILWFLLLLFTLPKISRRNRIAICIGMVFLSAAGDEFHQTSIPGRYGNIRDVFIDTAGGTAGAIFCRILRLK